MAKEEAVKICPRDIRRKSVTRIWHFSKAGYISLVNNGNIISVRIGLTSCIWSGFILETRYTYTIL